MLQELEQNKDCKVFLNFFFMGLLSRKVPLEIPEFLGSLVREHQIVIGYRKINVYPGCSHAFLCVELLNCDLFHHFQ